jgi:NAD(P)-dependent dehydrogenase (short-subunit alcohol dehydrogenase family)
MVTREVGPPRPRLEETTMVPMRLEGKTAIVTGAGSIGPGWGNGKAVSVLYARHGANVVVVDRKPEAAEETHSIITDEGGSSLAVVADVTSPEDIDRVISQALERFGSVDVLQNNVGIGIIGPTTEITEKEWDLVFKVNVKSAFHMVQRVLPVMVDRGTGSIINVSSVASVRWTGVPYASYAASKAALNQFSQSIALEYAKQGVRSNVLLVGYMDTPTIYAGQADFHGGASHEAIAAARNAVCPMGHMGDAWDVAHASLFLAGEESRYITGTQLVVDGGLAAASIAAAEKLP